ncbi:hypothetical protein IQ273_02310 [Nodosilinea sp. LEGE 07298]|uniref:hypothetical protein n=1 Tax=Nodosilinea sp. LEGE 07298 TaxID=2777970 RepID=UPI00187F4414|nr:hypothetical protein [Nodosilinea sp. LEGE 07298]MBE9108255.1 hypothetical protein [Nodosilinea sp. LEGE 07298]
MDSKQLVELSYDIQTGLGRLDVPDFDQMRIMGMAATLAVHIRGLGEINYEILRKVSDHYFNIPSSALKEVVNILGEVEYIQITKVGKTISSIIPDVPRFQDVYAGVGSYFSFSELNEHEQGTLLILSELQNKPENLDKIKNSMNFESKLLKRCLDIGADGNYIKSFRARGKNILASPFYFADNLESLVDVAAKSGATDIQRVIEVVKSNQGWPLSLIERSLEIGGTKLTETQKSLLVHLCQESVLKPPSLKFGNSQETFVFTPSPGNARLNFANREIYERAMALIACVRKGQLLPEAFRIRMPVRLLQSLREKGYLRNNSEAAIQYRELVFLKVGKLKQLGSDRWEFHLVRTEENEKALTLAIDLLRTGELANLEVDQDARLALSKDDEYIQSVLSAAELKQRRKSKLNEEAAEQFDQMILGFD